MVLQVRGPHLIALQPPHRKVSVWQTEDEADPANHETLRRYPAHSRVDVPMEVQEVRANRFVSLLVGDMANAKPLPNSSKPPRSQTKAD